MTAFADLQASRPAVTPLRLVASGTAMVAVSFGLARYGYGLLLPDIGRSLQLDGTTLGIVGSAAYVSYLLATAASSTLIRRLGQRGTVALGGVLATIGMLTVAGSTGAILLGLGIFVAGAAPALVWPPYVDAVEGQLPQQQRDRGHGVVNSGTAYGVAVGAPLALLVNSHWRTVWLLFAGCAAAATLWAIRTLPRRELTAAASATAARRLRPASLPLLAASTLIGLSGGAYWTFGVDAVTQHQLLGPSGGQLFQIVVGLSGVVGGLVGRLLSVLRPSRLFAALAVSVSTAELALAHAHGPVLALTSAILFGAGYIGIVGVTAVWCALAYPDSPSTGLRASMLCMGTGLAVGPAAAGTLADYAGLPAVFYTAAALAAILLLFAAAVPRRTAEAAPSPTSSVLS